MCLIRTVFHRRTVTTRRETTPFDARDGGLVHVGVGVSTLPCTVDRHRVQTLQRRSWFQNFRGETKKAAPTFSAIGR
jgi:hypothetical protein